MKSMAGRSSFYSGVLGCQDTSPTLPKHDKPMEERVPLDPSARGDPAGQGIMPSCFTALGPPGMSLKDQYQAHWWEGK